MNRALEEDCGEFTRVDGGGGCGRDLIRGALRGHYFVAQ